MHQITTGDSLHVLGPFGIHADYTVRLKLRLADAVDGELLRRAAEQTQRRYPYFSLRLRRTESGFFYEDNPAPVVVHHTADRIALNAPESNHHVWGVSYWEDWLCLEFFHGIADGTGMYAVLATLLYYYCAARYGVSDHSGIRTLEDPILPEETADPLDALPSLDPALLGGLPQAQTGAFDLIEDGGLTPSAPQIWDVEVPERAFVRFSSANDASPGTMVSILLARAIDSLYPERDKELVNAYVINARPMLGAGLSHHNCITAMSFVFSDRVKAMPFDRQCTVHRGTTFLQSDADRVRGTMTAISTAYRGALKSAPTAEAQVRTFGQMMSRKPRRSSYFVSYVGQWKQQALSPYVLEFWTHVPCFAGLTAEIAAINGTIFLSLHQPFREDAVIKSFLRQLDENGIPHREHGPLASDIPHFPAPTEER